MFNMTDQQNEGVIKTLLLPANEGIIVITLTYFFYNSDSFTATELKFGVVVDESHFQHIFQELIDCTGSVYCYYF